MTWKSIDWRAVVQLALGLAAGIVAAVGTLAVAVTSFSLSFDAIEAVAKAAHIREDIAWMMPVTVDGAMLVATVTAVMLDRLDRRTWYPWLVVVVGGAISILCNAAHATGDRGRELSLGEWERAFISAIPALMLMLAVHLLVTLVETVRTLSTPQPAAPTVRVPAGPPVNLVKSTRPAPSEGREGVTPPPPVDPAVTVTAKAGDPLPVNVASEGHRALPAVRPVTPQVKAPVKPKAAPKKTPPKKKTPAKAGVDIRSLHGDDLVRQIAEDFPDTTVSANKIRLKYAPLGTPGATEVYDRWRALTEGTSPSTAAPHSGEGSEAAVGGTQ